jgi:3D (Asp-Asp-Asp) domain-containing protein
MVATAYDLSIRCCGKRIGNPSRGITKSGYNLNGKSRAEAMAISSNDLPMGTRVELTFNGERSQYNGIYIVRDTGNLMANVIDVYINDFGERTGRETIEFGKAEVEVKIIEPILSR